MSTTQDNVIIDCGSSSIKSGLCGEKYPKSIIASSINKNHVYNDFKKKDPKLKDLVNNNDKSFYNSLNQGSKNYFKNGLIDDWEFILNSFSNIFTSELKINPEEYNLLITEPPHNTNKNRETLYQIMFENIKSKACYIANSSILSVFAAGKTSGISVDSGEACSHFLPVYEGYGIKQALNTSYIAGKELNEFLMKLLSEKGNNLNFSEFQLKIILSDIKEKFNYISNEYENELHNFSKKSETFYTDYSLPDQSIIKLGTEKFRCPEALFNPNLIGKGYGDGWHERINKSVLSLDLKKEDDEEEKIKKELYSNIILSGGNSMFKGLPERIVNETTKISGLNYCDVIAIPERKYSSWIGGSILSSISVFQSLWITKEDYEENGSYIINQKVL